MKQKRSLKSVSPVYFDRDLSWLSFNERLLDEAQRNTVPLMERIRFLAIYSSNLDEFYRVRMPALMALGRLKLNETVKPSGKLLQDINTKIITQQKYFGSIIENHLLQGLKQYNIHLLYNESIPDSIAAILKRYFIYEVAPYVKVAPLTGKTDFFPENNKLYLQVTTETRRKSKRSFIVNIPSDTLPRFFAASSEGVQYITFLDDIMKLNLPLLFPGQHISGSYNFKITRDAELDLQDEFSGNLAKKIEKRISQRDFGLPTRFLYEPGIPEPILKLLKKTLHLKSASFIKGGTYHNLKDLSSLPLKDPVLSYEAWPSVSHTIPDGQSLFSSIRIKDILLHPPYQKYDVVMRFFNEASIDPCVEKIYITLYRVAQNSRIAEALISAARNGKEVTVFVELKARFDEANNIKWSKRMKAAGVRIIESIPGLKVHAKLALVKRKEGSKSERLGLVATGNFNENTAQYYTDHVLMTADNALLKEAEELFLFLAKRKKKTQKSKITFNHLLVGQFNLQQKFLALIDREIAHAQQGLPSSIIIKLNNLEDKVLISRLYEASKAGVKIQLIVRSICCLVPGIAGLSDNITVKRIVDRYLEHGRVFIFHNAGNEEVLIGSADWMNRNIYRRIEVCTAIHDPVLKKELMDIIALQLADTQQAVTISHNCGNIHPDPDQGIPSVRSQKAIGEYLVRNRS
jgi:polyphosphate kinase